MQCCERVCAHTEYLCWHVCQHILISASDLPAGSSPPSTQHPEQVKLLYYLKNKRNVVGDTSSTNGDDNLAVVRFISILVHWRLCIYIALAFAHLYYRRFIRFVVYLYIHIFLSLYDFLSLYVIFFLSISLFQSRSMYPYSFLDWMYMIGVVIFARSYWSGRNVSYFQSHWILRIQVYSVLGSWYLILFLSLFHRIVALPCLWIQVMFINLRTNSSMFWNFFIVVTDHLSNFLPLYAGFLFFLCIILCLILYQDPVFCQFSRIQTKKFVCIYEYLSCWCITLHIYIFSAMGTSATYLSLHSTLTQTSSLVYTQMIDLSYRITCV